MKFFRSAALAVLLASGFAVATAFAQTATLWTSTFDTTFSTGANWSAGAPVDDTTSSLATFFTTVRTSVVLTSSQSVAGVSFSGVDPQITLSAAGGATLTLGASGLSNTPFRSGITAVSAPLAGPGGVSTSGPGTLWLLGANTYTGGTTLGGGTLNLGNASALGTGALTISAQSRITNTTGVALTLAANNPITLGGDLTYSGATNLNLGTGGVSLTGTRSLTVTDFGALIIPGTISQTGAGFGLTQAGLGTVVLSGTNSYSGPTTVGAGTLQLTQTSALYGGNTSSWTAANIIIGSRATLALNVGGTGEFTAANVTTLLANVSTFDNQGITAAAARIGFDTTNASGGTFTVADNIADSTGPGVGAVGVTKLGSNTLVLSGTNTYTGQTTVSAGTLRVTGSLGNSIVTVGGTLAGTGTIGGLTVIGIGGTLAPGSGAGLLSFGSYLLLGNSSTTAFTINGTTRGTTYDAVNVTGPTYFGGALTFNFTTAVSGGTTLDLFRLGTSTDDFFSVTATGVYSGSFTGASGVWTLTAANGQTLTFTNSTGDLVVTGIALPEPSTYAAIAGACALALAVWRRRATGAIPTA